MRQYYRNPRTLDKNRKQSVVHTIRISFLNKGGYIDKWFIPLTQNDVKDEMEFQSWFFISDDDKELNKLILQERVIEHLRGDGNYDSPTCTEDFWQLTLDYLVSMGLDNKIFNSNPAIEYVVCLYINDDESIPTKYEQLDIDTYNQMIEETSDYQD